MTTDCSALSDDFAMQKSRWFQRDFSYKFYPSILAIQYVKMIPIPMLDSHDSRVISSKFKNVTTAAMIVAAMAKLV